MATQDDCKRQLVKIAENNVELQYYLISPYNYKKVILPEYTISYGQQKIDDDRVEADAEWTFWAGLDAKGIADKISVAADNVKYYDDVQSVMNDVDGTIIELE